MLLGMTQPCTTKVNDTLRMVNAHTKAGHGWDEMIKFRGEVLPHIHFLQNRHIS